MSTTIGDFALSTLASRLLRQSTSQSYLQSLRLMQLWDEPLEALSLQLLYQRLLLVPNLNTRRKYTVALRSIFRDLPWITQLRIPTATPRIYELPTEEKLRFTLAFCPYEFQALLMMYAGLRCGEACVVQRSDLRGNVLRVHKQRYEDGSVVQAKTVGEVVIPVWLANRVVLTCKPTCTPGAVRESLRRYGKKTGIDLSPHMLRHWYATMMVNRRINPEIARRQMRHADLKTTLGYYAQVSKSDIDEVVSDLFDGPDTAS